MTKVNMKKKKKKMNKEQITTESKSKYIVQSAVYKQNLWLFQKNS